MADRSTNKIVVEYAVRQMMKKQSPRTAARSTAKRLNGDENVFIGPGTVEIDPAMLETALWDRLAAFVADAMLKVRSGFEHYALDGTILHFNQKPTMRAELNRRVISKLGADPFLNDAVS